MSKVSLVGAAALLSLVGIGAIMTHHSSATAPAVPASSRPTLTPVDQADQSTVSNALQPLGSAAKSLLYLPLMKRAIAASNPEILVEESVFQDAEVRLTGIGPIQIGMTLEEATDALGLPLVPIGSNVGGDCAYYQPDSVSQALGFMVVDNRVIRIDVWPGSSLATVSGAKIGSTLKDIDELYPGQIEATPNPYTQGEFLTLTPQDPELALFRLVFETDADGKVVQYRAGQFPAVTWPDGCV
ncbi:hypothetical protein [Leptolyngbya iicbica]|uniref:Uncharacterized protein n=2 Tax=Cyanophyceae TaxID=3028117 RepID=A0A4Q7E5D8_9CYAN|nr:hypothetical protein [Leptolyngbya sp. LK]RZM77269.1 hypothetical protein DYY88_16630 [Leptolyngbya sp. LK]